MSNLEDLTVEALRALATERGVVVPSDARKAEIIATLEAAVPDAVSAERSAVRVRVDGNGYADVRGERVRVGRTLAGAEVLFP